MGITLFFAVVIGIPLAVYLHRPATCFDGIMNQGETYTDMGGPCEILDPRTLTPHAVLWSRPFFVRNGVYSAAAYIENPNADAGVVEAPYRFQLYDSKNVLVAERQGTTYIVPGTVTPVFERQIDVGARTATRAFFELGSPLTWQRLVDMGDEVGVSNKILETPETAPRLTATVHNNNVALRQNLTIFAVVFDTAGNAIGASQTIVDRLAGNETRDIVFTWAQPFDRQVGRVDIIPSIPPASPR